MRKTNSILILVALIVGMISTTTLAHGGRGHNDARRQQPRYIHCTTEGCDLVGNHRHDSAWYCARAGECINYEICTVEGCTNIGLHEHDGTYYRCADYRRGNTRGRCR